MLDAAVSSQLSAYLEKVVQPIVLAASLDDSRKSIEMRELLEEVAALSPQVSFDLRNDNARKPSFRIERVGTEVGVVFAGIPMGHEFTSFVLALLQVGGHPAKLSEDTVEQIRSLPGDYVFETFFSLTCQNCPDVVQALNAMAVINPRVKHVAIDGALFQNEIDERKILAVPTVYLNGQLFDSGRMSIEQIIAKLDTGAEVRESERLQAKEPFDVLVIGGGPAGASAAIYSARKGIRTGVVAERIGGQVLDTIDIENLVSVLHTEGPKLAGALEAHMRQYDVDIMAGQRASALVPATADGLIEVKLESGASLFGRTVVLATGARWRRMNVPGETDYLNKGVTFCPHCDGPLFKGKRVAVIGGGNSGIEAAIDLAGVVGHVTVLEFDAQLRADEVLQRKLRSLANVDVIVSALTTAVIGDGDSVTGLHYENRLDQSMRSVELDGVFVQIGLLPSTEWLQDTVELTARGEIVIDDRGQTSVPGVFAAGDSTNTPCKQIVIALGGGATAALSAFDHLIRTSAPND
jgi:alkyl hydroperoxide reductase subunit F